MNRYAKIVQADTRGQIVIPKEVRQELNIEEGTGFYVYLIDNEGIFLKIIPLKELGDNTHMINEIEMNADKIAVKKQNVAKSIQDYKKTSKGNIQNVT